MVKLNVASGPNVFPYEGWTNYDKADFTGYFRHLRTAPLEGMPEHQQQVAKFIRERAGTWTTVLMRDATLGFKGLHGDNTVDFVYAGQFIEHLNRRTQVIPFLKECHRMLRPGGVLRMTTPDLILLLRKWEESLTGAFAEDQPDWFRDAPDDDQLCYLLFGASGPNCTQGNYEGHFHCYSEETMRLVLEEAGFREITFSPPARFEIRDEGMSHSLCVEATK